MKKNKWKGIVGAFFIVAPLIFLTHYILASSPVSDTFTDTSKIASNVGLTVDTGNGQVKLAASYSFTCGDPVVDSRDGKIYDTVLINSQCWMAQNMNIGTMTAGTNNQGTDCSSAVAIQKYCYSDTEENCTSDGALYQWDQAMCGSTTSGAQGICPAGWHIPTDAEQHTLDFGLWDGVTGTCDPTRNSAYGCTPAGTNLKPGGSTGFAGVLAGGRNTGGSFAVRGTFAYFWSSLESGANAWRRSLHSGQAGVNRYADSQANGLAVRCLKD